MLHGFRGTPWGKKDVFALSVLCLSLHPHKESRDTYSLRWRPAHSLPPKAGRPVQGWEGGPCA